MGNGIIGKILYFWIFLLGGLFFARVLGFSGDDRTMILFCLALAGVYIVFQTARALGKKNRAEKAAANRTPVHKGHANRKKRR